ncbi:MAG: DUF2922 domain-containing protein [Selenomonadaceae bacterium]|nr:DUF2922 domain-containing protein [Selenomonadaceae bacterium]
MRTLKMVFTLDNDKTSTFSLSTPKTGLTLAEVMEVSEAMLAKEAIVVGGSPIAELKDCYIQEVNRIELA